MEAGVVVFGGPESQGEGGQVVDQGDGVAVFGEVDGADVVAAGVAGFYADVGELFGDVDGELGFGFFAAGGAEDAAEFPFVEAEGAEQVAFAAVAFDAEDCRVMAAESQMGHTEWVVMAGGAARLEARNSA